MKLVQHIHPPCYQPNVSCSNLCMSLSTLNQTSQERERHFRPDAFVHRRGSSSNLVEHERLINFVFSVWVIYLVSFGIDNMWNLF